jgi:hypothetical protein
METIINTKNTHSKPDTDIKKCGIKSAIPVITRMNMHDITVIMNDIFSPQLVPTSHHYGTHAQ